MTRPGRDLPIGYWLKRADELITHAVDRAHAEHGVTRTDWQILNQLREADGANLHDLESTMAPFIDVFRLGEFLNRLEQRGWVRRSEQDGRVEYRLTAAGQTARQTLLVRQQSVRERTTQGISEDEYATTVRVLQRIVQNLEAAE